MNHNHHHHHHQHQLRRKITNNKNHHHPQPNIININTPPETNIEPPEEVTHFENLLKPNPPKQKHGLSQHLRVIFCSGFSCILPFPPQTTFPTMEKSSNQTTVTTTRTTHRTHVAWWISTVTPRLVMEECGAWKSFSIGKSDSAVWPLGLGFHQPGKKLPKKQQVF